MKQDMFLPDDYAPAESEPFMNERQVEYFRRKLQKWKSELLAGSRDTIEALQDGTRNIPNPCPSSMTWAADALPICLPWDCRNRRWPKACKPERT